MTEEEWLICPDPERMLNFLTGRTSERKLRLFAAACFRRIWHVLRDEESRTAVAVAESYADGQANEQELREAREGHFTQYISIRCKDAVAWPDAEGAARWSYLMATGQRVTFTGQVEYSRPGECLAQARLLRDLFGNPFHPIAANAAWLTWHDGLIPKLAAAIYETRRLPEGTLDNVRLAILADALEDAGCTDADILNHCRSDGDHVRGCWVVDLILGKE
jgi:hypothetical protein